MTGQIEIETRRLLLRRWKPSDLGPWIQMNQDPKVMKYFPHPLTPEESTYFYHRISEEFSEYGYGLYATEEKASGEFLGFIGFHWTRIPVDFCPCVEIGWRLISSSWGKGYATEGAKACLDHGFNKLNLNKVYSFTSVHNGASEAVMKKIGMNFHGFFDHPALEEGHWLRKHVCYSLAKG